MKELSNGITKCLIQPGYGILFRVLNLVKPREQNEPEEITRRVMCKLLQRAKLPLVDGMEVQKWN